MPFSRYIALVALLTTIAVAGFFTASVALVQKLVEPVDNVNRSLALLHATHAKMAAFGDSRLAFDYANGPGSVNLAYPGESVEDMAARLDIYLANQPAPEMIILEADPHLFARYRLGTVKSYLSDQDKTWLGSIFPMDRRHYPLLTSYWRRLLVEGGIRESKFRFHDSGWQENRDRFAELPPAERTLWAKGRVHQHEPVAGFQEGASVKAYRDMVARVEQAGARVCLVATPVSAAYARLADDRPRFAEARRLFAKIAAEARDRRLVDLTDLYPGDRNTDMFADTDHLNEMGARRFAQVVDRACTEEDPE